MRSSAFVTAALFGAASAWPWNSASDVFSSALPPTSALPQGLTGIPMGPGPVSIKHYPSGTGSIFPTGSGLPTGSYYHHSGSGRPTGHHSGSAVPSGSAFSSGLPSYTRKHHSTGVKSGSGIFPPGPTGSGTVAPGTSGSGGGSPTTTGVPPPSTITITSNVPSTITSTITGITTITQTISELIHRDRNLVDCS